MSGIIGKRFLTVCTFILLLISTTQIVLGENIDDNLHNMNKTEINETFDDCVILIFGTCNEVQGPVIWRLGLYCNLIKRNFVINAKGEIDENINLIIRGGGSFKFLWGKENIFIRINGANGILFWAEKSIIVDTNHIIARCKADSVYLTYE
jgi:hypothetical protein